MCNNTDQQTIQHQGRLTTQLFLCSANKNKRCRAWSGANIDPMAEHHGTYSRGTLAQHMIDQLLLVAGW
jgi:hypothetical protein